MATPAEVIDLFADVREGSSFERARAAASAFRAFGSLSATEKRELAVLVAERSAPELVPRIRAETGLDLTREQVQAVIDMAGRMDSDDIDELRHAVRDQEARGHALRTAGTAAAAAAAGVTGMDDVIDAPDEAPEDAAGGSVPPQQAAPGPDRPVAPDADLAPDIDSSELEELGVESELVELDHDPEPAAPIAPAPEPRPFVSVFDDLPDLPSFEPRADEGTPTPGPAPEPVSDPDEASTPAPAVAVADAPGALPAPTATVTDLHARDTVDLTTRVRATRQPLVERLRGQSGAAGCLRTLHAHLADLADMDATSRTAVVDAIPDGWARRRALQVMLERGVLPAAEVPDLIRRVGSPVARAWVSATAVEADMLHVDQLDDLLEPRAATRLHRRYR